MGAEFISLIAHKPWSPMPRVRRARVPCSVQRGGVAAAIHKADLVIAVRPSLHALGDDVHVGGGDGAHVLWSLHLPALSNRCCPRGRTIRSRRQRTKRRRLQLYLLGPMVTNPFRAAMSTIVAMWRIRRVDRLPHRAWQNCLQRPSSGAAIVPRPTCVRQYRPRRPSSDTPL